MQQLHHAYSDYGGGAKRTRVSRVYLTKQSYLAHFTPSQSVNDILQSKDFHSQFPKLEVADGDRIGIDLYLRFVQELVQDVEGVFAEV